MNKKAKATLLPPGMEDGTPRQRDAARTLKELRLAEELADGSPRLVGTIPLGIDVEGSDLDVICEAADLTAWLARVKELYGERENFRASPDGFGMATASFRHRGWEIELFAQNRPTEEQNGYRHMAVEARLLRLMPLWARERIVGWKAAGIKTEPAFARLLAIPGDPYAALLELERQTDEALARLLADAGIE